MHEHTFSSAGVTISYIHERPAVEHRATPVLLIHGFASNAATNWGNTGWIRELTADGYRVIALDNRGHGKSEKLYGLEDYSPRFMAEDARRLLDHLSVPKAHIVGYSMGARISAFFAIAHPEKVKSLVFGGLGINMVKGMAGAGPIAHALEAESADHVKSDAARTFRIFAEQTQSDLKALAACIRSSRERLTAEAVATIRAPVLVAVGEHDVIAGSAEELAALIPGAEAFGIKDREHMKSVGDRTFKHKVKSFLEAHDKE